MLIKYFITKLQNKIKFKFNNNKENCKYYYWKNHSVNNIFDKYDTIIKENN